MAGKRRVLVVDDELRILRFVRTSLSIAGYEVTTASNGEEALRLAKAEEPALMVLDVRMAPLDGFEVLNELRKFSRMPVIIFTAGEMTIEQARQCGANDCISKPFRPEDLVSKVETLLKSTG